MDRRRPSGAQRRALGRKLSALLYFESLVRRGDFRRMSAREAAAGGQLCVLRHLCLGKTRRPQNRRRPFFSFSLCLRASVVILVFSASPRLSGEYSFAACRAAPRRGALKPPASQPHPQMGGCRLVLDSATLPGVRGFSAVFIAVVLGFALTTGAFLVNRARPSGEASQPDAALVRASGKCAECHYRLQYSVVHEFEMSMHAKKNVSCLECHQPGDRTGA